MDHSADFVVEEEEAVPQGKAGASTAHRVDAASDQYKANWQAAKTQEEKQRLAQRQKQVDFGKNTIGYQRYIQQVPKERRRARDPVTPDVHENISKRSFEGQVKAWRRALHAWDNGLGASDPRGQGHVSQPSGTQPEKDQAPASSRLSGSSSDGSDRSLSQGSLEGYLAPKAGPSNKKRALEKELSELEPASYDLGAHKHRSREINRGSTAKDGPDFAKRITSTTIKDTEDGPCMAPTCFPNPQSASVIQTYGPTQQNMPGAEDSAQDNVVAMILGSDNGSRSAMSWATEDQPVL